MMMMMIFKIIGYTLTIFVSLYIICIVMPILILSTFFIKIINVLWIKKTK
jgi:hypothetical protein